jgi:hypothetical protein
LGKIAKKIILLLDYLIQHLLYDNQIGGGKDISAIDTVVSLIHDTQLAKSERLITSALFLEY